MQGIFHAVLWTLSVYAGFCCLWGFCCLVFKFSDWLGNEFRDLRPGAGIVDEDNSPVVLLEADYVMES